MTHDDQSLIGRNIRITKPHGPEHTFHARINSITDNDLFVMVVRPNGAHPETWNLEHTLVGLRSGFYQFGQWGDP